MISYYVVKQDLPGVPAGVIERFSDHRAPLYVADGAIEPFDEKNKEHIALRERLSKKNEKRVAAVEELLTLERESPAAWRAKEEQRREEHAKREAAERTSVDRLAARRAAAREGAHSLAEIDVLEAAIA